MKENLHTLLRDLSDLRHFIDADDAIQGDDARALQRHLQAAEDALHCAFGLVADRALTVAKEVAF